MNESYLPKLLKRLDDYEVHVQTEKGLSYAVWNGIHASKESIVAVMDADGSHPAEAIAKMIKLLDDKTWFVIGSRYCQGGQSQDSLLRRIISVCYCLLAQVMLQTLICDSMSGFWLGYRDRFTFQPGGNYKFGLQLIRKYRKHIVEFPISFAKRREGKSHVKPVQALKDLLEVIHVAWQRM